MNFVDHSRGHTPAKKDDHKRWDVQLYHNQCGKKVTSSWNGYGCAGPCAVGWHNSIMDGFNDDAMATRFHIRTEPDRAEYAIVWKVDEYSKRMYTTLVPVAEAHKYERFKL